MHREFSFFVPRVETWYKHFAAYFSDLDLWRCSLGKQLVGQHDVSIDWLTGWRLLTECTTGGDSEGRLKHRITLL